MRDSSSDNPFAAEPPTPVPVSQAPQLTAVCIAESKFPEPVETVPVAPLPLFAATAEDQHGAPKWEFGSQAHQAELARANEVSWAVRAIHRLWVFVIAVTMALVGGVLVVFLGGFVLSYYYDDIPLAQQKFDAEERVFWTEFHAALDQSGAGKLTGPQLADQIEQEFLPRWRTMAERFRNLESIPPGDQEVVDFFKQYIQLREDAMALHVEALRTGDAEKLQQRNEKLWRADQLRQQHGGQLPIR